MRDIFQGFTRSSFWQRYHKCKDVTTVKIVAWNKEWGNFDLLNISKVRLNYIPKFSSKFTWNTLSVHYKDRQVSLGWGHSTLLVSNVVLMGEDFASFQSVKHRKPLTQRHSVTSHNTSIFNNNAVRNTNIADRAVLSCAIYIFAVFSNPNKEINKYLW